MTPEPSVTVPAVPPKTAVSFAALFQVAEAPLSQPEPPEVQAPLPPPETPLPITVVPSQ